MIFTATLLAAIGCVLFYKARASGGLSRKVTVAMKIAASFSLFASLLAFFEVYSVLKATFVWLGVVSLAGCMIVLIAGSRARPASR